MYHSPDWFGEQAAPQMKEGVAKGSPNLSSASSQN